MTDLRNRFHEHADGTFTIETYQDVGPYLERNRRELNDKIGAAYRNKADGLGRKIASIPNVIAEKWYRELGVKAWDKNDMPKVMALLRDPDYRDLRTAPGRI